MIATWYAIPCAGIGHDDKGHKRRCPGKGADLGFVWVGMSSFQRGKAYSLLERGSRRAQNSLELLKIVSEYVPVGLERENSK